MEKYNIIGKPTVRKLLLAVGLILVLSSCNDGKLAKQLDGTWQGSITTSFDDQSKAYETIYTTFHYDDDAYTDGGTLEEKRVTKVTNIDLDDCTADAVYNSYIEGTWEVIWGDLYIYYDVSSLNVSVNEKDVNIHWQSISQPFDAFNDLFSYGYNVKDDLTRQLQKNAYTELFKAYKKDAAQAEDAPYADLKVNGNTMSYETADVGRLTFTRISSNNENTDN